MFAFRYLQSASRVHVFAAYVFHHFHSFVILHKRKKQQNFGIWSRRLCLSDYSNNASCVHVFVCGWRFLCMHSGLTLPNLEIEEKTATQRPTQNGFFIRCTVHRPPLVSPLLSFSLLRLSHTLAIATKRRIFWTPISCFNHSNQRKYWHRHRTLQKNEQQK